MDGFYPWQEIELTFKSEHGYEQPYLKVEMWLNFTHTATGTKLRRPAFWDGGQTWKVRFASPGLIGEWSWDSFCNQTDKGLCDLTGVIEVQASESANRFYKNGFWRMSEGKRNLIHANGQPALLCGDTAWALPWRATLDQVDVYAKDRQSKGFNAALLMLVQPDMRAEGPDSRTKDYGFARGFEDLPQGHLNELRPEYFQYLDTIIERLIEHEIVPVYQPAFHGFGWKGQGVIGAVVSGEEVSRLCRYVVARYGARPAIYLVGADGYGDLDSIRMSGEAVESWDAYRQPTGVHYNPMALNKSWQDCDWLDFQWCQTGHGEEHLPERVMDMWHQKPAKAVCNAEPTYERMEGFKAEGWWQGHEAWSNLCSGGTMGVVYGAASLWQWRLHKDEPGHLQWCVDPESGWREALDFEGADYPGVLRRILEKYPFTDMEPDWQLSLGKRGLRAGDGFYLCYLEAGGNVWVTQPQVAPDEYRVYCALSGEVLSSGKLSEGNPIEVERGRPAVLVCGNVSL